MDIENIRPNAPGYFISLVGPEGGGKTVLIPKIRKCLEGRGLLVLCTREPGGTPIGGLIRNILTAEEDIPMESKTETLLFQASRAELVEKLLRPELKTGKIAVVDRFSDCTLAYQVFGRGMDRERVQALIDFATDGLTPDLTFWLDLPVEVGLERKRKQGEWNRLDAVDKEFHERVRLGYETLFNEDQVGRMCRIDADRPLDNVFGELKDILLQRLVTAGYLGSL